MLSYIKDQPVFILSIYILSLQLWKGSAPSSKTPIFHSLRIAQYLLLTMVTRNRLSCQVCGYTEFHQLLYLSPSSPGTSLESHLTEHWRLRKSWQLIRALCLEWSQLLAIIWGVFSAKHSRWVCPEYYFRATGSRLFQTTSLAFKSWFHVCFPHQGLQWEDVL